jgi:phosphoribosylformylglycinamidine synthase
LGGSEYLASVHQTVAGQPPVVNFEQERQVQAVCREGIRRGWVRSAHDCAEGGLAIALAESCISANLGATITLPDQTSHRWDTLLFGEAGARIVVSVAPENAEIWETFLQEQLGDYPSGELRSNFWQKLGQVGDPASGLRISTDGSSSLVNVTMAEAADCWKNAIARRLSV